MGARRSCTPGTLAHPVYVRRKPTSHLSTSHGRRPCIRLRALGASRSLVSVTALHRLPGVLMTRVLVATGSSTNRRMLAGLLESVPDFEIVAQADDGVEAVELAERLEPDLIAIDLYLPGLNGIEATQAIMARAPTRI